MRILNMCVGAICLILLIGIMVVGMVEQTTSLKEAFSSPSASPRLVYKTAETPGIIPARD